jgi:hypothetical protein
LPKSFAGWSLVRVGVELGQRQRTGEARFLARALDAQAEAGRILPVHCTPPLKLRLLA